MKLSDFATLALAKVYEDIKYSKITIGQASQYFGLSGMLDVLEANSANTTELVLSATMTTTVGALCRTVLTSAKTTGFVCDPATEDGLNNRGAAQLLLGAGVFPNQGVIDGFWAKGTTITKPHINATQEDFDEANDAGQELALDNNLEQHHVRMRLGIKPRKPVTVTIQHQFGSEGDLTDWINVGTVQMEHPQKVYKQLVPAIPEGATVRNLRIKSPLSLNITSEDI